MSGENDFTFIATHDFASDVKLGGVNDVFQVGLVVQ